jgi:hypothetical protein
VNVHTSGAAEIAKALGGKRSGKGWACKCPAHDDSNASFSVSDGKNGSPVFHCHAKCTQADLMEALVKRGLWNEPGSGRSNSDWIDHMARAKASGHAKPEPEPERVWGPWKEVCTYDYIDADGALLFQLVKSERFATDGTKEKKLPGRRPDGSGGWIWDKGDRRALYRWPDLLAYPDANLFVCEGEKDADRVAALGCCATTIQGKWADVDIGTIAGRDVFVMEDADEPGTDRSAEAAEALHGLAKTLRIVRLPGQEYTAKKGGKDVSDWLDEDPARDRDALADACLAAPLWTPGVITRLSDWLERELGAPDFVLGDLMTTTSRALLFAETGIGKTMFGIAAAVRMAAGKTWLRWKGRRPLRVLYIDGEMSQRLLKQRLIDEVKRSGLCPDTLHVLSHDDIPDFQPLNTPAGQQQIERHIKRLGGVDFIWFDNIMSLTVGDMKDELSWSQTLAWAKSLTRRAIGQVWVHHTGHDSSRSYGSKTKEWQMDTVIGLAKVEHDDTDVSFKLTFHKARERTPTNRSEFAEVVVTLIDDKWECTDAGRPPGHVPAETLKFYEALGEAIANNSKANNVNGHPAASFVDWQAACVQRGLIDRKTKPDSARALFSRHRVRLIAANRIVTNDTMAWLAEQQIVDAHKAPGFG